MFYLVTTNTHKFLEAKAVLKEFGIKVEQIKDEKYEGKELSLQEVAELNAKSFFEKYKKPVCVDDTGVFFRAYPDFPGNHPKLVFNMLGYKGLLKLLENENREAFFKSVVSYYDGKNLKSFTGELECTVDTKVQNLDKDVLAYERILLIEGKPISSLLIDEKNKISHRAKAFRMLGKWLKEIPL